MEQHSAALHSRLQLLLMLKFLNCPASNSPSAHLLVPLRAEPCRRWRDSEGSSSLAPLSPLLAAGEDTGWATTRLRGTSWRSQSLVCGLLAGEESGSCIKDSLGREEEAGHECLIWPSHGSLAGMMEFSLFGISYVSVLFCSFWKKSIYLFGCLGS